MIERAYLITDGIEQAIVMDFTPERAVEKYCLSFDKPACELTVTEHQPILPACVYDATYVPPFFISLKEKINTKALIPCKHLVRDIAPITFDQGPTKAPTVVTQATAPRPIPRKRTRE